MIVRVLVPGSLFPRLSSAITLLKSRGRRVLVDTGAAISASRLLQALEDEGVAPADIDTIVSTHLHYDHCGNHLLFPRAHYLVSTRDYTDTRAFVMFYHSDRSTGKRDTAELLRSHNQTVKEFYVRSIVREVTRNVDFYDALLSGDRRFATLTGGAWLTDEIEVLPSPGHTMGHLSVLAHGTRLEGLARPVDVLIAGDALPTYEMLQEGGDRNLELAADTVLYRSTRRQLLDRFRYIVPGHSSLVDTSPTAIHAASGRHSRALSNFVQVEAR